MIKFLVNDDYLEVSPGTSIDLEFNNPMFSDTGTHSFEITFPNSRRNRRILNFPGRIANLSNTKPSYDLEIISGSLRLKGKLNITETGSDYFKGYYTENIGEFNYLTADKYLTDIESPPTEWDTVTDYRDYVDETLGEDATERDFIYFSIHNPNLFDDHGYETNWKTLRNYINGFNMENYEFEEHLIPQFKLHYIIKYLFSTFGFEVTENFLKKEDELKNVVLIADILRYRSRDQYSGLTWYNYTFIPNGIGIDPYINIKNYMLYYPVKDFIAAIEDIFCAIFFISGYKVKFLTWNELLSQVDYIDITGKAYDEIVEEKEDPETGYNLGYDWDSSDENIGQYEIDNFYRIDDVETVDDLPVYTVDKDNHLDEICLVTEINAFYLYYKNESNDYLWGYLNDNYYPVRSGDEKLEISSPVNIPKSSWDDDDQMFIPRMLSKAYDYDEHPFAGQGGVNYAFDYSTYADRHPRLTVYRGQIILNDDTATDTFDNGDIVDYWLTINHNLGTENVFMKLYDNLGTEIDHLFDVIDENSIKTELGDYYPLTGTWTWEVTCNLPVPVANSHTVYQVKSGEWHEHTGAEYSLHWDGDKGLYEKFWKNYIYWKENFRKFVKIDIRWKPADLQNLDFSKKYRVRSQDYFIKKIHVKITASGLMEFDNTELVRV